MLHSRVIYLCVRHLKVGCVAHLVAYVFACSLASSLDLTGHGRHENTFAQPSGGALAGRATSLSLHRRLSATVPPTQVDPQVFDPSSELYNDTDEVVAAAPEPTPQQPPQQAPQQRDPRPNQAPSHATRDNVGAPDGSSTDTTNRNQPEVQMNYGPVIVDASGPVTVDAASDDDAATSTRLRDALPEPAAAADANAPVIISVG